MKKIIHKSESRGYFNHGWLKTHHTFSFARYYDPERVHFGMLRVLNDDTVDGGGGFGMHPHDNMEIVSIPLKGILDHADSMGHEKGLTPGMIQVMSAGTGVTHSEYNGSKTEPVEFLQIWVLTDRQNHTPRYKDIELEPLKKNTLQKIVGPVNEASEHIGGINQQAWFYLAGLTKDGAVEHTMHGGREMGTYVFVIEGSVSVNGEVLGRRDVIGIWDTDKITVEAAEESEVLLIEVPMK